MEKNITLDISPEEPFNAAIEFATHVKYGAEFDNLINGLNDNYKNNEVTLGLRFILLKPEDGEKVKVAITQHLEQLKEQFPPLAMYLSLGLSVEFRTAGNEFNIDIHVSGACWQQLQSMMPWWSIVDISNVVFAGHHDLSIQSGFDPVSLLTASVDDLVNSCSRLKIQGRVHSENLANALNYVREYVTTHHPNMKPIKLALNVINIIQVAGFELKYDLHALIDMILSVPGKEEAQGALQLSLIHI